MKTGTVVKTFNAKDGRKVILRTPKWEDIDDFVELTNSLVEEGADVVANHKVTREQVADLLGRQFAEIEKGERFMLVAEVDGKAVANAFVTRQTGYSKHVGRLFVAVKNGFRDIGIGMEMVKTLVSQAEKTGLKMVILYVFSTNKRAKHVYEKVGFRETGRIPNEIYKKGKFTDHIIMVKELATLN